MRLFVELLRKP